jgi:HEXXH motif-containing protein
VDAPTAAQFAVRNHRLAQSDFEALCAGRGDRAVVRQLWQTQRSRRLLLINAVVEAADAQPRLLGPLPPATAAWQILAAAEMAAPHRFADVLLHPQVGSWAAYTLRRHRGGAHSDAPLWTDFGGLHAVALVAAAGAGLTWQTRVPARAGRVMLPGLGMAVFMDTAGWTHVEARTDGTGIVLRHDGREVAVPIGSAGDVPGWWSLRRLRMGDEPELAVSLDDLDPFRDLADPVPPHRLDGAALAGWRDLLADAWTLLCRHHPEAAGPLAEGVVSLVPLPAGQGRETRSASTGEAFGSVLISPPSDPVTLAVSLVHEFQHIKLGGLMHLGPLTVEPDGQWHYAPWRDDPRPLTGLVQGVYAFVGIAAFWRAYRRAVTGVDARLADFEYAYARGQADEALRTLSASGGLTRWGGRLVEGLAGRVRPWLAEPLPPEATRAARLVADCHRAGWRIRHAQPPPSAVDALAGAWCDGRTVVLPGGASAIVPHPQLRWSQGILGLVRRRILAPGAGRADGPRPRNPDGADLALVRGDIDGARDGYLARVAVDPDDLDGWAGLAVAAGGAARDCLPDRPELVRAVYLAVAARGAAPDPVGLAAWITRAMTALPA